VEAGATGFPDPGVEITQLFVVRDLDASVVFYTGVLGAELVRAYGGTSAVLRFAGTWVLLVTGGGPTADKPTVTFEAPGDPDRVSREITLRVADCTATYEALRARRAEFLTPPVEYEREVRAFFRDPDGHLFEISEAR